MSPNRVRACPDEFGERNRRLRMMNRQVLTNDALREAATAEQVAYADWFQPGMVVADLIGSHSPGGVDCIHPMIGFPYLKQVMIEATVGSLGRTTACLV